MKNVLIFPCGSEIGLEVNRALAHSIHFTIFGGSSVDDHGKFVFKNYIDGIPFIEEPNFIDALNKIILENQIDFVIPADDSVVLKMAEHQSQINAVVVTSNARTCQICRSKSKTYEVFQGLIPTPRVYQISEKMSFPIFLKPDSGKGSKGTYTVNSKEEVDFYFKKDPTLLALEYLPGKEYTVDCFTDKNGILLFAEGRERKRIYNGISVNSKLSVNPKFQELAKVINNTLSFQGVWFYQVKERTNGELVLMEIAPRIAGTMGLFRVSGVNFIQLSLFDRMGIDVEILNNNLNVEIDRALFARYWIKEQFSDVYIDLDDTIIVNGEVNTDVIKFLYQARNMGKRIVLLSRHKSEISKTLEKFAISEMLFNEIKPIGKEQKKSSLIDSKSAIFIDDSFAERKEVFDKLQIPVFGLDAIESLLVWKV